MIYFWAWSYIISRLEFRASLKNKKFYVHLQWTKKIKQKIMYSYLNRSEFSHSLMASYVFGCEKSIKAIFLSVRTFDIWNFLILFLFRKKNFRKFDSTLFIVLTQKKQVTKIVDASGKCAIILAWLEKPKTQVKAIATPVLTLIFERMR